MTQSVKSLFGKDTVTGYTDNRTKEVKVFQFLVQCTEM